MAPAAGSYNRHRSFAIVVLPAPFWPTMASDEPAGIVRSNPASTGSVEVGYANVTLRKRISRAGIPAGSRWRGASESLTKAPAGSIAASRRSTAAAGAAALSSAHESPPKAIMLVLTAALAKVTRLPSARPPPAAVLPNDQNTTTFATNTNRRLHITGRSRRRVAFQR